MDDLVLEIPNKANLAELRESAEAACRTIELAEKHDLSFDEEFNINLPPPAGTDVPPSKMPVQRASASLLEIYNMLQEYGGSLNATTDQVRNTIINKLLLETDNPDGRIRIKALELLGKVPEIGLFSPSRGRKDPDDDDSDVTEKLKARLRDLKQGAEGVYEVASEPEKP
jgi:hypothetical protein